MSGIVVVVVSHIPRIGCQSEKTTLHDGQSHSWSGEQKREKNRKSGRAPPPPPPCCSFGEKKRKKSPDASTCLGATQVSVCLTTYKIPSTRRLGQCVYYYYLPIQNRQVLATEDKNEREIMKMKHVSQEESWKANRLPY